jgi:hypothetical protein
MSISWERARGIFGNSASPRSVWERQFDFFDDELRRLCSTPWREIDFGDLWYYYHDLAFTQLQPEVFAYLFPVCLMAWHDTLMRNVSCALGDAEFHFGVHQGRVFEKMMTLGQRTAVFEFFKDSFLARLDQERGFVYRASNTPAYGWMCRFNSLGIVMPRIDLLWDSWWAIETPGRAVAAIEYLSGLIYPTGQNPLFPAWNAQDGGGDPPMFGHDSSIADSGWMDENTSFLRDVLTPGFVVEMLRRAVRSLATEAEYQLARQLEDDLPNRLNVVEARVTQLPALLSKANVATTWTEYAGD